MSNVETPSKKTKKARFKKNFIQDWLDAILWAFVVAMIIRNYTFQNFKIPSSSMEQTLLVGDYLVANKMKYYFTEPERGDIVTFKNPGDPLHPNDQEDPYSGRQPFKGRYVRLISPVYWDKDKGFFAWYEKKDVVKRVIGMPGDKVEIKDKVVYVNDEIYETGTEQYADFRIYPRNVQHPQYRILWDDIHQGSRVHLGSRDNFGPVVVDEGHYFVLGDNRDHSLDSRYFGFLSRKDITGTPAMIFFSKGDNGEGIRWERSFTIIK